MEELESLDSENKAPNWLLTDTKKIIKQATEI